MIPPRIKQKLREIEDSLAMIEEALPSEVEAFMSLGLVKDGIYKRLEFCIQNVIDIFFIIYSSLNLGVPSTTEDVFLGLDTKKIFPHPIIILVQEMKGLRNILAHRYGKVDDTIVYEILSERIRDFNKIVRAIERHFSERQK